MALREPPFSESDLRAIGKCLGVAATHSEFGSLIRDAGLSEDTNTSGLAKWQRVYNALAKAQNSTRTGNPAMKFIQTVASPQRFVSNPAGFEDLRGEVNHLLAFRMAIV